MRLIDADNIKKQFMKMDKRKSLNMDVEDMIALIDNEPTIDIFKYYETEQRASNDSKRWQDNTSD